MSIPHAPYVTSLPWVSHYGCHFVVHGDDITSDSNGEDCYRFVKAAGRFLVVKRTPGISTTDLVGRMLLCTKNHFIRSFARTLSGEEGPGSADERTSLAKEMNRRIKDYASDETGLRPGVVVLSCTEAEIPSKDGPNQVPTKYTTMVDGVRPKTGQRIVYVDGGFDLFSSGHIEFLRQVVNAEGALAYQTGWYEASATGQRRASGDGSDYGPVYLVAGVHDDEVINHWKGVNYPIMNIFERGLCVLQCRVGHAPTSLSLGLSAEVLINWPLCRMSCNEHLAAWAFVTRVTAGQSRQSLSKSVLAIDLVFTPQVLLSTVYRVRLVGSGVVHADLL